MDGEQDNLMRGTKKFKTIGGESGQRGTTKNDGGDDFDIRRNSTYKDKVLGMNQHTMEDDGMELDGEM